VCAITENDANSKEAIGDEGVPRELEACVDLDITRKEESAREKGITGRRSLRSIQMLPSRNSLKRRLPCG
jgi:hypothetical protein